MFLGRMLLIATWVIRWVGVPEPLEIRLGFTFLLETDGVAGLHVYADHGPRVVVHGVPETAVAVCYKAFSMSLRKLIGLVSSHNADCVVHSESPVSQGLIP